MGNVSIVAATEHGLTIAADGAEATVSWRWVRDHCEDEFSFDPATRQRRVYALDECPPQPAVDAVVTTVADREVIAVRWPESPESTWITTATVRSLLRPVPTRDIQVWHCPDQVEVTKGSVEQVLHDDRALAAWLSDLDRFGFGLLDGFAGGHDETATLARRIGHPRSSIFGPTWDLSSDIDAHDDTAYSNSFLAPHTDGTYSHEPPGLQMFCCVERSGTGGESVIVDGFAIAETLRADHPDDFRVLTEIAVPAHYIEPGVELRAARPAIVLDEAGAVIQVSMNNYDRSPMLLPEPEMTAFYRSYGRLHDLANDRDRWLSVRLEAGDVLINDNWRVLHGREAYTGGRRFVGCYLNHEDFESRARVLGI